MIDNLSGCTAAILTLIYLQCVSQIKSQYSEIWYDSLSNCNSWTKDGGVISCGITSNDGCQSSPCVRIQADTNYAYLERSTNIASYSSLQFQVSISTNGMDSGDECNVWYQYDSGSYEKLYSVNPPNDGGWYHYSNTVRSLPSAVGKTKLILWLENLNGGTGDYCFFDNAYLRGILEVGATAKPTPQPTPRPTPKPTTRAPTSNPAPNPTAPVPTANPVPKLTTKAPTPTTTATPTEIQTPAPVIVAVSNPDPTTSPTVPASLPTINLIATLKPPTFPTDNLITTVYTSQATDNINEVTASDTTVFAILNTMEMTVLMIVLFSCCILCVIYVGCSVAKKREKDPEEIVIDADLRKKKHAITSISQEEQSSDDETMNGEEAEESIAAVAQWLVNIVGLPQYMRCFLSNGYTSLYTIQRMESPRELEKIGVILKGHQSLLMTEIVKLKGGKLSVVMEEGEDPDIDEAGMHLFDGDREDETGMYNMYLFNKYVDNGSGSGQANYGGIGKNTDYYANNSANGENNVHMIADDDVSSDNASQDEICNGEMSHPLHRQSTLSSAMYDNCPLNTTADMPGRRLHTIM